jgi:teichuronic acid biosynthesis glycosyltransferase TuaC
MIEWAARRADASIGVCSALVDVLRGWGLPAERLHVMRNGVDLRRFHPVPTSVARRKLGLEGAPVLLSVGHLVERKGHHIAVAAMPHVLSQHPNARLLIVGAGEEQTRLQEQIRSLGIGGQVRLVGAVANQELADWYSAADAMILASSREGWANVLLESMACGTPVVATRIWGTPEVVGSEAVGLLVDRRDGEAFGSALLQLLALPRDRQAVRRYAEGFSWEATSAAQLALFERLATAR